MARGASQAEAAGLLHNSGWGGPQAFLEWRGFDNLPLPDLEQRLGRAATRGTWLEVSYCVPADSAQGGDWNNSRALLRLVQPEPALSEDAAARTLTGLIEAHSHALDWPDFLVTDSDRLRLASELLRIDHALTVFVALAKSTGSLWLRRRPARLAPLHTPDEFPDPRKKSTPGYRWRTRLWFPGGIPAGLLSAIRNANKGDRP